MSKRYVIQVNVATFAGAEPLWEIVQHPAGGDWKTRSRSTAIADAARLVHEGETRELRIGVSKPVYAVTPDVDFAAIKAAEAAINWADAGDFEDEVDEDEDEDEDEDAEYDGDDAPIAFELVDEDATAPGKIGEVFKTDADDPDAPQII